MATSETAPVVPVNRTIQLVAGVICMVMIANLQYGWTYFVDPINAKFHWGRPAIQVAFTIFVATETWLVPVEGWFVDRFGPRIVVMFGGIVVAGMSLPGSMRSSFGGAGLGVGCAVCCWAAANPACAARNSARVARRIGVRGMMVTFVV